MAHIRTKLSIAGVVLACAVGYLAFAGIKKGWVYYLDVDAFVQDAAYQHERVRLHGKVAEDKFETNPGLLTARFGLLGGAERLTVSYQGAVPPTFKTGVEVVVEGKLDDAGVFRADVLMTKCASKYQAEEHAARLETAS